MGSSLQTRNPVIVSAFHTALLHQLLVIGLVLIVLSLAWNVVRTAQFRRAARAGGDGHGDTDADAPGTATSSADGGLSFPMALGVEPLARRVLRTGFALLWIVDGVLQLQSSMPLGLPSGVLGPSASTSPGWVASIVHAGVTIWSEHPIQAAASAVWIQVGLGALLLLAPRGRWSRLAGAASAAWGLVVWVFGEAFGGIFGHGASWLFGVPGAVLFYCVAGVLLALPERAWTSPRLGRGLLRGAGIFYLGMALLQAWPGRGFWQGAHGPSGTGGLTAMVRQMAGTPQPGVFASIVRWFGRVDAAHGWGVNLAVVLVLGAIGVGLCVASPRVARVATAGAVLLGVADWLLVQDLGFFGGVGTDPNSMVPLLILLVSSYLAMVRPASAPAASPAAAPPAVAGSPTASTVAAGGGAERTPGWVTMPPLALTRALAAVAALAVVLVGAVPMTAAAVSRRTDPILATALDGTPNQVDIPAPDFSLTDQAGHPVTLASLRGRVVALTFLDPVCTSDCPLIAQEFRQADAMLGGSSPRVAFVAVVANPIYRAVPFLVAFDRQEGLEHLHNWFFLTGSPAALAQVWRRYGVVAQVAPAGAMVDHSDIAYLIDAQGHTREVLSTVPGTGTASASSYSSYLTQGLERVLHA